MAKVKVLNRIIGEKYKPFIIAEMSGNHNQSLEKALEIVDAAVEAGADAIKLQTYTADTMTLNVKNKDFFIANKDSLWKGNYLYDLYKKAYTPWEWHKSIFDRCKQKGLICFSTPFDETAVDFLEELSVPCYKIASFEITHLPLIKKVAKTRKPMIISTGMATISEIEDAVKTARENGCKDLILLKCNSGYPALHEESNLLTIPHMRDLFNCEVGLSDHSLGIGTAIASVVLGATVIEKHFAISRDDGGVDSAFSMNKEEMKSLVIETEIAWKSLGKVSYGPTEKEEQSKNFRRSIYFSKDLKAGEIVTTDKIKIIRPGFGLSPRYFEKIIGMKVKKNVKKGVAVSINLLN